jgi:hypothetical protein
MDGVLVDTSHRYRNKPDGTIDLDYWFKMRTKENIMKDKLLPLAEQYRKDCENPNIYTVICTSRMEHEHDVEFITNVLGKPDKLIMRPHGDMRADGELKYRKLRGLFSLRQFNNLPKRFWEDNVKNIRACATLFNETFLIKSEICENG